MMNCAECGNSVPVGYLVGGVCPSCMDDPSGEDEPDVETYDHILATTEASTALDIKDRIAVIGAETVLGTNIFADLGASIRDVVGGRSRSYEKSIKSAREAVLLDIRRQASQLGGSAVVAIQVSYSEISGGGKSMLMVAATGTVVTLYPVVHPA